MNQPKLDIAVLGGGFAGVYCAKRLHKRLGKKLRIGLIAEENYKVFQPMLPEVVGASIPPDHVVNPLRLLCRGIRIFRGKVEKIVWPDKKFVLNAGAFTGNLEIHFDHLVLALGAVIDLSSIPGMPEHAYLMQNVGDAMLLRAAIIYRIEEADLEPDPVTKRRLLTFVVVGGGYSGVETAGQILDLFRSIYVYYPSLTLNDFQVYLIHGHDHLLPTLSRKLGEYSAQRLSERGLKLVLNQRVKAVTASRVYLQDGSAIETNTVISTVGNAPHPLVAELCKANGFPTERGRILTEPTCLVKGQTHLWAAGDCAAVPYIQGGFCPATAQMGMRQGILLGENLPRQLQGQALEPFKFKSLGEMASIGHRTAVADIFGFHFSGFIAWWLWRTVYLVKLPRLDRKIRVMLDWTLDLLFPRDINLLSPRHSMRLKEIHLEKGDILFHQGEAAFSFYIVKSGAMEIYDATGVVETLTAGEYFGERALLEDGFWRFNARARDPSTLVSVPAAIFQQIVRGSGTLGRFFQKSAHKYESRDIVQAITRKIPDRVRSKTAADLMQPNVLTCRPSMTVAEAATLTKEHPHSCYPVVDDGGRILGVIQREDFYEFLKRAETSPNTRLQEMPLATLPTVPGHVSVEDMIQNLVRSGANKLLVVDGGDRLQGILTIMDLV